VQVTATDASETHEPIFTSQKRSPALGDASTGSTSSDAAAVTPAPLRLAAGEEANVASGHVAKSVNPKTDNVLAWRQRRLVFYDARMADVAAEFNRYNRTQIRIEGSAAQDKILTGIFDADRPQSLMLYAAKDDSLEVQPDGNNWVIRAR